MTRQELHRRLQIAEAAVAHLSRLQWRRAGRSGGSVGRILMLARIDRLERAVAQALYWLDDAKANLGDLDDLPVGVDLGFYLLDAALGESDWRGEIKGWDGKDEMEPPAPAVPPGGDIIMDGERYRLGAPGPDGRILGIRID